MTAKLWQARDYVVPSPPDPKLTLSQTPHGILAQYDASYEHDGKVRRLAYYVEPNMERIGKRQKPVFVNPTKAGSQIIIPILAPAKAQEPKPQLYAVYLPNDSAFSIYCRGEEVLGPCELPVFKDPRLTAEQVALTPLTVVGDGSIVGACVGFFWALGHNDGAASNPDGSPSNFY